MDEDYEQLGLGGLDYFLPGIDLTLWLRLILATVAIVVVVIAVVLKS
jgi:hypothetical protein